MQHIPQVDNYSAIDAYVRRVYNPNGEARIADAMTIQPTVYPLSFDDIAAGAVQTKIVNIAANADFVLSKIIANASIANTLANNYGGIKMLLVDTGSQDQLMSEAIDLFAYCQSPPFGAPVGITYPRLFTGRSAISVQIRNYSDLLSSSFTVDTLRLSFVGVHVRSFLSP